MPDIIGAIVISKASIVGGNGAYPSGGVEIAGMRGRLIERIFRGVGACMARRV
jgi:hypothetical protein